MNETVHKSSRVRRFVRSYFGRIAVVFVLIVVVNPARFSDNAPALPGDLNWLETMPDGTS